ncbi:MAG: gliding motility-associated C-terminal domain-containing protein, partial [Bacteroidota bacterium]
MAFAIKEYRNGVLINTTIRDMQILVDDCDDAPPQIETQTEICVVAGTKIEIPVIATDPDNGQLIKLTALGGPFEQDFRPASFTVSSNFEPSPVTGIFEWQTACEHISDQFYSVVFKAVDNLLDTTGLAALKTLRIKVVGPPPENLTAESERGAIVLNWDKPYSCENTLDNFFQGFSVWRRNGSNLFDIDSCQGGLAGQGYTKIVFNTTNMVDGKYSYTDSTAERGITYCYRILAEFAQISAGGQPFNRVESLPSNEVCLQVNRDVPLISNVDVINTDASVGEIFIRWLKPLADELDTIDNPGPYTSVLQRADGINGSNFIDVPGATFTANQFSDIVDTTFNDVNLNTIGQAYTYRIAFFTNGNLTDVFGYSAVASSIFLTVSPADRALVLTWEEFVPWQNIYYDIFKQNNSGGFDSIGRTNDQEFIDGNLINGEEYCYYVRSTGAYSIESLQDLELVNKSQQSCGSP